MIVTANAEDLWTPLNLLRFKTTRLWCAARRNHQRITHWSRPIQAIRSINAEGVGTVRVTMDRQPSESAVVGSLAKSRRPFEFPRENPFDLLNIELGYVKLNS